MTLWDVIAWIIMGALVGWIASLIVGTNEKQGGMANIIVGIIGAFIGGLVMHLFGASGASATNAFSWQSFFVALLGAVILLFIYRLATKGGHHHGTV